MYDRGCIFNDRIYLQLLRDVYKRQAIDILSCTEYDAVILDIMMPKADGFTVLRALRGMGKTTPGLFLTAKDAVSDLSLIHI